MIPLFDPAQHWESRPSTTPAPLSTFADELNRKTYNYCVNVLSRRLINYGPDPMALLLRKLRYSRWFAAKNSISDPLPADPLADLSPRPRTLCLSGEIFTDHSNLSHVITALAAPADHVSNIDVAILEVSQLTGCWTRFCMTPPRTIYTHAAPYHRDIADLTAADLVHMAQDIRQHAAFHEFSEKDVANLLAQAIHENRLKLDDLQPKVIQHLRKKGLVSTREPRPVLLIYGSLHYLRFAHQADALRT